MIFILLSHPFIDTKEKTGPKQQLYAAFRPARIIDGAPAGATSEFPVLPKSFLSVSNLLGFPINKNKVYINHKLTIDALTSKTSQFLVSRL